MAVKFQDYYETLGVARTATPDDIKKAYRKLARKFHPDVNKSAGAEDRFKKIGEAYEVLSDPDKRRKYDALGANWRGGQDFTTPPGWEGIRFERGPGREGAEFAFEGGDFSDFFEMLFGGGGLPRGARRPGGARAAAWNERGPDHEADVSIPLEDAWKGARRTFSLEASEPGPDGRMHRQTRTYTVAIPPGTADGARIRLSAQGGRGQGRGEAGDLYLRVHIEPHPVFRLLGRDLEVDLPVAPWEAALGQPVEVPTLGGKASLTLPPGTQSGQRLRLRGQGMPAKGGKGDLFAVVKIVVPRTLSARERGLFEELARHSSFKPRD